MCDSESGKLAELTYSNAACRGILRDRTKLLELNACLLDEDGTSTLWTGLDCRDSSEGGPSHLLGLLLCFFGHLTL